MANIGNFNSRLSAHDVSFKDFVNPWNCYGVFFKPQKELKEWLMEHGLFMNVVYCQHCEVLCNLQVREKRTDGFVWRCTKNRNHEIGLRKYSFFDSSHFPIADIMQFIKSAVDGESLHMMAMDSGMDYKKKSSVDWASFCREIAMEYVYRDVLGRGADPPMKLNGHIEIDESCFGSRTKYHIGQKRGLNVWVVGLIERSSNRIILYPVDNRDAATLTSIIQRHVEPGSHIYTDGWSAHTEAC